MNHLSSDDLLAQATCAVLIEGKIAGTAWLVSQEGYLLTAGHLFGQNNPLPEVEVQFIDDIPRKVCQILTDFQREMGIDFALLKLDELSIDRQPLPVSLARSVKGTFTLRGYGEALRNAATGTGEFTGVVDRQDSSFNRLFRLRSGELVDVGFSGGAVYSNQLDAVVAIQIEAGDDPFSPLAQTVLAMPLYRIAELWEPLTDLAIVSTPSKQSASPLLERWLFVSNNWKWLVVVIVLELGIVALYLSYRELYRISWSYWLLGACLLMASAGGWYSWSLFKKSKIRLALALLATFSLAAMVGRQGAQIAFPERFEPQAFGIAVAELGEGGYFRRTSQTRELSDQVYENLCAEVKKAFNGEANERCRAVEQASNTTLVEVRQIGVLSNSEMAQAYGKRIGADLVIWGQLLTTKEGQATIRFQLLETPDRAVNPELPLVLPVTTTTAEVLINPELDLESDPAKLKEAVALQSTVISSYVLGLVSYLELDYPEAVNRFKAAAQGLENPALKISPEGKSLLYFYLGKANNSAGQIDEGQEWLKLAQEANPNEPAVPLALALGYGSAGQEQKRDQQLELALDLIHRWLASHPNHSAASYNRGIIYQIRKQFYNARLDFKEVLEHDPDYYIAYISASQAAVEIECFEEAQDLLNAAIELASSSGTNPSWAYLNLGQVYEQAKQPEEAKKAYLQAIDLAPEVSWMYYYYAQFLEAQQEMDAALLQYRKITEIERYNKGWAFGQLAGFLKRRGFIEEALENYQQAVHAEPKDALLHTYLAEIYFALGDVERALDEFEQAIAQSETIYYIYAIYANTLFKLDEVERAAEMYQKALELRPLDHAVLLNLGKTYERLGEHEKAMEQYRKILGTQEEFTEETIQEAGKRLERLER